MTLSDLPASLPADGLGEDAALALVSGLVRARSAPLGAPDAVAHMDPPTPRVAADLVGLNAAMNQNLLHPDLSPFATQAEHRVIDWLAPAFGMTAGHMCAGSTIANIAALWCAREHGARCVVASADAHVSVPKAAHILGLPFQTVPVDADGRLAAGEVPDLSQAALVLTAGTTGRGAIDPLHLAATRQGAAWVHVDAAWAGPLRLTRLGDLLDGMDAADSVALSAHKWLFQPKESALVLFRHPDAQVAISYGGAYLATPNIGVQGSRGAAGVALLGTLLAWGRAGLAARIETCMSLAEDLADRLQADPRVTLRRRPETGVLTWKPRRGDTEQVIAALGPAASRTAIDGVPWVRHAVANPQADPNAVWARISAVLSDRGD